MGRTHLLRLFSFFALAVVTALVGSGKFSDVEAESQVSAVDDIEFELLGHLLGGDSRAVAVEAPYAYFGLGNHLQVVDISDLEHPVAVASLEAPGEAYSIESIALFAGKAYIVTTDLWIVDIADPLNPLTVATYETPAYPFKVEVVASGSSAYAYLADAEGLETIDVSDPANPTQIAYLAAEYDFLTDFAVQGTVVYMADIEFPASGGLRIVDLFDPTNPVELGWLPQSDVSAVALHEVGSTRYAFLSTSYGNELLTVDVTDPTNPAIVASYFDAYASFSDMLISGNFLYSTDGSLGAMPRQAGQATPRVDSPDSGGHGLGLLVVNIADPTNLAHASFLETPFWPSALALIPTGAADSPAGGADLILAEGRGGIRIVRLNDPSHPVEAGVYLGAGHATDVVDDGAGHAYVAGGVSGLRVVDLSTLAAPVGVGVTEYVDAAGPVSARNVILNGGYAFLAEEGAGMSVVDVSDPRDPLRVARKEYTTYDVDIEGNLAFAAGMFGELAIWDISDPLEPALVARHDAPYNYPYSVDAYTTPAGSYAYVADGNGLWIVDVGNPALPVTTGLYEVEFGDAANEVTLAEIDGSLYAFVSTYFAGLRIVDVTDPAAPSEVSGYATSGPVVGVAVAAQGGRILAYVAAGPEGVHLLDVSDPAAPELLHTLPLEGANGVALYESRLYVAANTNGLYIYAVSQPGGDLYLPLLLKP